MSKETEHDLEGEAALKFFGAAGSGWIREEIKKMETDTVPTAKHLAVWPEGVRSRCCDAPVVLHADGLECTKCRKWCAGGVEGHAQ